MHIYDGLCSFACSVLFERDVLFCVTYAFVCCVLL
jgi:hypothetical protein